MLKVTQNYKLMTLLSSGEAVKVESLREALNINYYSVSVYIHELKKFGAEIESVREGKKVIAYKLLNYEKIKNKISQYRSNNSQVEKKTENKVSKKEAKTNTVPNADGSFPTIDPDNELAQVSENEMNDIKDSLGLGEDLNMDVSF